MSRKIDFASPCARFAARQQLAGFHKTRLGVRLMYKELSKFALVGVANTLIDFGVFASLFYVASWNLLISNTTAYAIALINSFLMNKYWTFSQHNKHIHWSRQFPVFLAISLIGLSLSNLTIWLLVMVSHPVVAKAGSIVTVFFWNFWSSRRFVFNSD